MARTRFHPSHGTSVLLTLVACGLLGAAPAYAQQPAAPAVRKTVKALRITDPPRIDGVLDEPAWQAAEAISDFVQQEPNVDQPVSERTVARILLGDDALYIGVECSDSTPGGIIARELRRDNSLLTDDRLEIILDTFHDRRNAYHFVVNPLGTQYDALITDEGQDINIEWDERWWSSGTISDTGWVVEIRIPFTTLRSRPDIDTYGLNLKRFIRRKNEIAQWTGWDRDYTFLNVSQAGELTGMAGIETGLKLRVKPYALGGFRTTNISDTVDTDPLHEVGIEVMKFSLTPALTAELTLNTDFAQTEVDDAVVNLTRFPQFFPEKREFFLERAGIFEFGLGGRRGGEAERNLQMFFSRRIGLTDDRRQVPIIGGGKLIGQAAGLDLGVLNVQTDDFEGTPGSNYTVVRAKRNIFARSNVGTFFSNRQSSGDDYNRVVGGDVNLTFFKSTDIQGFLARSFTERPGNPAASRNDNAARMKFNWFTDLYEVFLEHLYVGDDFQHDVGFVRRRGIERSNAAFIWEPRPGVLDIRNFVVRGEVVYLTNTQGDLLTREQYFRFTTRFQSDDAFRIQAADILDRIERPFEIVPGVVVPAGEYHYADVWLEGETSPKRPIGVKSRFGAGDFYDGTRTFWQIGPSWRPTSRLSFEVAYEGNDVTLPQGTFTTHVVNARINVNLSNRLLTSTILQRDTIADRNVVYMRLNYIYRPGDDLFVVYSQTDQGSGRIPDRSLMVKVTHSFDLR